MHCWNVAIYWQRDWRKKTNSYDTSSFAASGKSDNTAECMIFAVG